MPFKMIMITANIVSRTTEPPSFEWIITAEIAAASMAVTARVSMSVPNGSPRCTAIASACRTTHSAAPMMTANSQRDITAWRIGLAGSEYKKSPANRNMSAVTTLTARSHSLRKREGALVGGTWARCKLGAEDSESDGPCPAPMISFGPMAKTVGRGLIALRGVLLAALAAGTPVAAMADEDMAHMSGHMLMTELRKPGPHDREQADAVVAAAREAMAPYQDYKKALADGYEIFLPNIPQPQYHFTNHANGLEARQRFDPLKPTSLLYKKTADGGYRLVGVMYTDRVDATEEEIDGRIPLSIARWHQHVNFCKAPPDRKAEYFGPDAKFGLLGSISTRDACETAGGTFIAHVFGWMVHVYPYEKDPQRIWSTMDDDEGHDNMDHSSMPGMKMN